MMSSVNDDDGMEVVKSWINREKRHHIYEEKYEEKFMIYMVMYYKYW